jgi:transcriptional regulator with XRE-family HTH domain
MDAFTQELPRRVQNARRDPSQLNYALYVYCRRLQLGISRSHLAELSGIAPARLTFIENGLLLAGEPTKEDVSRLEPVLGISYDAFMAREANRHLIVQVKRYKFGYSRLDEVRNKLLGVLVKLRPSALAQTLVCN